MKDQLLAFELFKNNDDFLAWQKEAKRQINMVSPIVNNANITSEIGNCGSIDGFTFGCFVLHFVDA